MTHTHPQQPCATRHAIILAAGESTRTRPLTLHRPKPLIPMQGQPLLAHILDELVGLIEQVTLVVGYRADALRAFFGEEYRGIAVRYVHQQRINGTAGALLTVAEQTAMGALHREPFFLLYGDNLVSQEDLLRVCQQRYSMAALPVDDPSAFGILDTADGCVRRIIEKPPDAPPGSLANPGIYHLDTQVLPVLERIQPSPRGEYELTDLIEMLAQEHPVGYHECVGHWLPISTPWDVVSGVAFLLERGAALRPSVDPFASIAADVEMSGHIVMGKAQVGAGCRITGPAFIADGVTIGAGCTIERSVLEAGVTVGDDCVLQHAVLLAGSHVGNESELAWSILDDNASVGADTRMPARRFEEVKPIATTQGVLALDTFRWRGSVLAAGVVLPPGTHLQPGSVVQA